MQSHQLSLVQFDQTVVTAKYSLSVRAFAKPMSPLVPLVMFGWIPVVIYLFSRYPAQQAVVISYVAGFLFLPQVVKYPIVSGIPAYDKVSATTYAILLATLIFDSRRFSAFKVGLLDVPILVWSFCPIFSQFANGLSPISPTTVQVVTWGLPYFIGRIYLSDLAGLRQLAVGIFVGGLIYAPLCLLETRIAPTLHLRVYGFHARADFSQTMRYGGYRPTVFMEHGLWVGVWMMAAALLGIWMWKTKALTKLNGIPILRLVVGLFVIFVMVKSTGAYLYLAIGLGVLLIAGWLRTSIPVIILILALSSYLYLGASGTLYTIPQVKAFVASANDDRSGSLAFRLINEEVLSEKARRQVVFGWGDSGGNRIYDDEGKDISITDSLWIIAFGLQGAVGLISFTGSLFVPSLGFCFSRYPPNTWSHPKVAPAAALAMVLILYMLDSALNAMVCPVFLVAAGGIAGLVQQEPEVKKTASIRPSANKRPLVQQRPG